MTRVPRSIGPRRYSTVLYVRMELDYERVEPVTETRDARESGESAEDCLHVYRRSSTYSWVLNILVLYSRI